MPTYRSVWNKISANLVGFRCILLSDFLYKTRFHQSGSFAYIHWKLPWNNKTAFPQRFLTIISSQQEGMSQGCWKVWWLLKSLMSFKSLPQWMCFRRCCKLFWLQASPVSDHSTLTFLVNRQCRKPAWTDLFLCKL